jgi:hypothetical protein
LIACWIGKGGIELVHLTVASNIDNEPLTRPICANFFPLLPVEHRAFARSAQRRQFFNWVWRSNKSFSKETPIEVAGYLW